MEFLLFDAYRDFHLLHLGFLHSLSMLLDDAQSPLCILLVGISPDYAHHDLVALSVRVVARMCHPGEWRTDFLLLFFFPGFFPNPGGSCEGGDDEFLDVRLVFSNSCC